MKIRKDQKERSKNRKKLVRSGLGVLLAFSMAGCVSVIDPSGEPAAEKAAAYRKISAGEAKQMMDAGGVSIVDVRTESEYAEGHIPEAVNIPNEEIGEAPPELLPDRDAVLLIYCRSGRRSRDASDKLVKMGYTQVYDFGGIIDWKYDVVKGEGENDR